METAVPADPVAAATVVEVVAVVADVGPADPVVRAAPAAAPPKAAAETAKPLHPASPKPHLRQTQAWHGAFFPPRPPAHVAVRQSQSNRGDTLPLHLDPNRPPPVQTTPVPTRAHAAPPASAAQPPTPHDFAHFDLSGMIRCGRGIRALAERAVTMEHAAQLVVGYLRTFLSDAETGRNDCILVRCFKTHRLGALPAHLRARAEESLVSSQTAAPHDELRCLTLLATAGDLAEWNDRAASTSHAVIPFESVEMVERAPMIAQLIYQMGLEIGAILDPSAELLIEADERACGVFYVPDAVDSPCIPAQDFVKEHHVRSVIGFGGLLPSGDLFSLIVFSRAPISRDTAILFRTIALSVKLVLLPFTHAAIFNGDSEPEHLNRTGHTDEQVRSEIATLRLLIPALEDAALSQTRRLEGAVINLELRAEQVQKLGARLSSVLESTTDAVFMVDRHWNFTYLNRHAFSLLRSEGGLLGKNLWEEFPAAVDSSFWTNYHKAMREAVPVSFEEYYPAPLERWFDVHVFPTEDGLAIFFHDVTDIRLTNQALLQNEKLTAVGRLAASIAHEINNPLEAVTNLLFLAQGSDNLQQVKNYLSTADRELRRIGAITTQTLRFHKQSSNPTTVSCAHLVEGVLSMYQGRIVNAHLDVSERSRCHARVLCYEGEIRQVLNNLVANALDALPPGGRLLLRDREGTDWRTGRRGVFLTVADTGCGMPPHAKAKLFDAFFSTKGVGGTGLGLWISKGIMERHAGKFLLRSSQHPRHHGTVFAIFLPFDGVQTNPA